MKPISNMEVIDAAIVDVFGDFVYSQPITDKEQKNINGFVVK